MRNVMMVVTVLMISCQVSNFRKAKVGAHTRISTTQNAKNGARLTMFEHQPANLSNAVLSPETWLGISTVMGPPLSRVLPFPSTFQPSERPPLYLGLRPRRSEQSGLHRECTLLPPCTGASHSSRRSSS